MNLRPLLQPDAAWLDDPHPRRILGVAVATILGLAAYGFTVGWWRPVVTTATPEMEADAVQLGAAIQAEPYYGSTRVRADFGTNLKAYFQFVSKHHMRVYGHQLAIVGGLKAS